MERGSLTLLRTLQLHAVCAFLGALATFPQVAASRYVGGALAATLLYTLVAWTVTSTAVRRSAIAIEASQGGLEPWLRLIAIGSVVGYGAIAAFVRLGSRMHYTYPDDYPTLGIIALVGILIIFGSLPEAAARYVAAEEERKALNGLLGGRPSGVRTTSAQGHRIGRGGAPTSSPSSSSPGAAKGPKTAPRRPRWFGKKPLAPSPLDSILGDRDFLK